MAAKGAHCFQFAADLTEHQRYIQNQPDIEVLQDICSERLIPVKKTITEESFFSAEELHEFVNETDK